MDGRIRTNTQTKVIDRAERVLLSSVAGLSDDVPVHNDKARSTTIFFRSWTTCLLLRLMHVRW